MCGIAGYFSKKENHSLNENLQRAVIRLNKRGPDLQQIEVLSKRVGFGHARLSIIDTSAAGNQPMKDNSGRYTLIFNGEIFNYRELKKEFLKDDLFHSASDSEVLLHLYIRYGADCLNYLNGFFAFAIYDSQEEKTFIARDRYGIKPLHVYEDDNCMLFASELKAFFEFPIKKEIDFNSLSLYLQLNYIPRSSSILKNVSRLLPGHYLTINKNGSVETKKFYSIPYEAGKIISADENYDEAKQKLKTLVEEAVQRRLVSDVPLGAFLSGGIDSSIVVASAAKKQEHLNTFSIGYKDEPYFDETKYANLVAKKYNTNHTVFPLTNDEMFGHLFEILDYTDEPFADSSGIAVYILSNRTRKKVTVALSGDGGDELFAGYNKHRAELRARNNNFVNFVLKNSNGILSLFPQSRQSKAMNFFRQLKRYSDGLNLSASDRYWRWCQLASAGEANALLKNKNAFDEKETEARIAFVKNCVSEKGDLNDVLFADTQMVLPNDMLTKVDYYSMANSLEVRVPLLDYTVVNYAFSLPVSYKIEKGNGKKILKDAFREDLPKELFNRPKHGFEVPLLGWLRTGLRSLIENDLLGKKFVAEQNIFAVDETEKLKQQLFSSSPGDAHARIWALLVFQYWYKKYFTS